MARDLTATMQSEMAAASKRLIFFFELEFTGGTVRLCTMPYTVSWDGQSWLGGGSLLGFSEIRESTQVEATGFSVSLVASSALAQLALAQSRTGHSGKMWVGTLDASGAVNADPYLAFEGRLDVPRIDKNARPVITITYESRLRDLERPREERITHEELQRRHPGDLFRQYVPELQEKTLVW